MRRAKLGLMLPAHPPSGNWHYQFRILLLGDSTVGKTSLLWYVFLFPVLCLHNSGHSYYM
uniref:Uncharacterized protein n=1 Tax=Naja naja TaxID=35670 RepID=A0A8C6VSP7_NAJNA